MTIKEVYDYSEKIGSMVFSTKGIINSDEIYSRIAHFNGYDDEGIYFRTMESKPYYRQLMENGDITVCGISASSSVSHDENNMAHFEAGFTFRLIGKAKNISFDELKKRAKNHKYIQMALDDAIRYPSMENANFVIYKAKVEIYDYDFEKSKRENKINRIRGEFGGMPFNQAGPTINEKCISCNKCYTVCSFNAIKKSEKKNDIYSIIHEFCDDCGMCIRVCPKNAIDASLEF